jgi:hypothetical protein
MTSYTVSRTDPPEKRSGARNLDLTKQQETTAPSDPKNQTPAQRALGDFAPKLVGLTHDVRRVAARAN